MVAIVFLFQVFAVTLLTLASKISLRPEYQCEVAAHQCEGAGSHMADISKCHKHAGCDLRPSPFLSLPRPSKEQCYSCDFVHGPCTDETQVLPFCPHVSTSRTALLECASFVAQPWTWSSREIIMQIILHSAWNIAT